jgi:hypothetical protein
MPIGPTAVQSAISAVGGFARSTASSAGRRVAAREVEGHVVADDGNEFDIVVVLNAGAARTRAMITGVATVAAGHVTGVLRDPAGSLVGRFTEQGREPEDAMQADELPHDYHYRVRFPDGSTLEGDGDVS